MLNKKCPSCAKKIERKFNYCPYCGESFKARTEAEDYGFLGRDDTAKVAREEPELKLPFGLNKVVNSLVRQLEKQMNDVNMEDIQKNMPRGFKIKISTGQGPQMMEEPTKKEIPIREEITETEMRRRNKLPKIEAESHVRRLSDKIIYEIKTPGVHTKRNVMISELATGLEIRAYSKTKCYIKYIPIKVELTNYYLQGETLFIECKT